MSGGGPNGAVTPSGLIVPADVLDAAVQDGQVAAALNADGRRRIVLTRDDQKALDKAIQLLKSADLGIVVCCRKCNEAMLPERNDEPGKAADPGYGCSCSRVHFRQSVLVAVK